MADAMDDRKAVAMLNSGKDERPPVRAVRTWIKEHLQRWRVSESQLDFVLEKTLEDPEVDLALFITAEPLHSTNKSAYRRVKASLTSDQFSGYGGAETESASRLIQNVFKAVINMPRKLFTAALGKLEALEESAKQSAVKTRFKTFEEKLYEVRFHATFEQSDAIEKLVGILKPHTFLMNQVMGEWASGAKDNVALSALLKSVKKRVDEKHEGLSQADNSPNTPSDGSSKKRGGGKPYQPSSAQSQSKSWRKPADLSSRPDNACNEFWRSGKCSFKSCRFQHVSNTPSVNQIVSNHTKGLRNQIAGDVQGLVREAMDAHDQREAMFGMMSEQRELDLEEMLGQFEPGIQRGENEGADGESAAAERSVYM
jgi:ribosomal protein S17E